MNVYVVFEKDAEVPQVFASKGAMERFSEGKVIRAVFEVPLVKREYKRAEVTA
jgi:hypothetical protein